MSLPRSLFHRWPRSAPANSRPSHVVTAHHDFLYIVLNEPFNELVARFGVAPSVFIGAGNDQSVGLCRRLKHLIVVRLGASAAVLGMEHFGVVLVAHLMQEGGCHVLNRSVQRPGCDVDFPPLLSFNAPRRIKGIMSIGSGATLNRDDWRFQLPVEEICIELVIQFSSCPASLLVFVVSFMVVAPFIFRSVPGGGGRCGCGLICFPFRIPSRSRLVFLVGSRLSVHLDRFRFLPLSDYHYTLNLSVCLLAKQPRYTLFSVHIVHYFLVYIRANSAAIKSAGLFLRAFCFQFRLYL